MTVFSRTERWWGFIFLTAIAVIGATGGFTNDKELLVVAGFGLFAALWFIDARVDQIRSDLEANHLDIDSRLPRTDLYWAATVMIASAGLTVQLMTIWSGHGWINGIIIPVSMLPAVAYAAFWLRRFEDAVFRLGAGTARPEPVAPVHSVPFTRRHGNG